MRTPFRERLAVIVLVHLALAILVPGESGHSLTATFSISLVLLSAGALTGGRRDEPADR